MRARPITRTVIRSALLVLALTGGIAGGAGGVAAEPVAVVGAEGLRALGYQMLDAGNAAGALQAAEALLARDPNDGSAWVLKSRAARDLGDMATALAAARRSWALAQNDPQRFDAAMTMAQALATEGRRTTAQFWLRRAGEYAPDERARALARRDFRYVKSRNPLALQFSASLAPSSNINNGSSATRIGFGELSGDARALSGLEGTLTFSAKYRLPPTETQATEFTFLAHARQYWLSDEAKAQAPNARGSDYAYAVVEAGIGHRFRLAESTTAFSVGAALGHNWYGGDPLSDYLRLEAGVERPLSQRTLLTLDATAERQWRKDNPVRSADILGLTAGLLHRLQGGDQLRLTLGVKDTASRQKAIDHQSVNLGLDWAKAEPVKGVLIGAGLSAEWRDYADFPLTLSGRTDTKVGAQVSATFTKVDYMGFSPTVTLSASRANSNIPWYDTTEYGLSVGIRSSF